MFGVATLCAAQSEEETEVVLTRGPYIQSVTVNSAYLLLETELPTKLTLQLRGKRDRRKFRLKSKTEAHVKRLRKLKSGVRYKYVVKAPTGELLAEGQFKTPPLKATKRSHRIAVVGDSGTGSDEQYAVAAQMEAWAPDLMLHTGDVVYERGEQKNYVTKFFLPYRALLRRAPFYPTLGNHDVKNVDVYLENFILPGKSSKSGSERFYSFKHGPATFIAIDTNMDISESSEQYRWLLAKLQQDRKQNPKGWQIVFFHHPPFSSSLHGDDDDVKISLVPVLNTFGADLVLSGHEHSYERLNVGGLTYVVTGGGGRSLYDFQEATVGSEVFVSTHHFVGLTINKNLLQVEAIDTTGNRIDTFSVPRR